MAPEILKLIEDIRNPAKRDSIKIEYDPEKADVYSLGVVIGSVCALQMIDASEPKESFSAKLEKIRSDYPKLHSLVIDMVKPDPHTRKNFRKLAEYLEGYRNDLSKFPFFELEFVSGLKAELESKETKVFEKTFVEWTKKGDFNMKSNFYGEAIICYLKVYEMVKRGELPYNKEYSPVTQRSVHADPHRLDEDSEVSEGAAELRRVADYSEDVLQEHKEKSREELGTGRRVPERLQRVHLDPHPAEQTARSSRRTSPSRSSSWRRRTR